MRLLITGAAGFIGSRLATAAARAGHQVRCVDALRGDPFTRTQRGGRLDDLRRLGEVTTTDLAVDDLAPLLDGVDAVAHLAGATGVRTSFGEGLADTVRDNVTATGRIAQACADGPRLVVSSSSSVYGPVRDGRADESSPLAPMSPYGASKLAAEEMVRAIARTSGLHAVILRYFTVYGPGQRPDMAAARFFAALESGQPVPVLGDGSQVRSYTYVDDVVDATLRALTLPDVPPGVVNIGGAELVSTTELAQAVARAAGLPCDVEHQPPARGDVARTAADTTRAADVLGWHPTTMLAEGLAYQAASRRSSR